VKAGVVAAAVTTDVDGGNLLLIRPAARVHAGDGEGHGMFEARAAALACGGGAADGCDVKHRSLSKARGQLQRIAQRRRESGAVKGESAKE
jgi:hypothetical protein